MNSTNHAVEQRESSGRPSLKKNIRSAGSHTKSKSDCIAELSSLYERIKQKGNNPYLTLHGQLNSLRRQVDVFFLYKDYLPEDGTILDWGCRHAPDSCLMRYVLGDSPKLLGYDFDCDEMLQEFHRYAKLEFQKATHTFKLPYEDESLDIVLGSGVLEHVAITSESLKELYRVLKVGGAFIITFLPNTLSYTHYLLKMQGSNLYHRRLYSRRSINELLLNFGFEPQISGYHQFIPAQRGGIVSGRLWFLNQYLERLWPFKNFCANHYVIAIKRAWI